MIKRLLFKNRISKIVFFALIAVACFSCKSQFDQYYTQNGNSKGGYLFDKIQSNPNFSIFSTGLQLTGLNQYVASGGLYTVFAPTDSAFRQYFQSKGYNSLNDVPSDTLFAILNYHIVNNMWYYYDFQTRYSSYQQTLYLTRGKKFVTVDVTATDTLKVNGISVIKSLRDIGADNGVIHGIGTVLIPKRNLEQVLSTDPQFQKSIFYRLMKVCSAQTYDRFNSYDKNHDGKIDSVFYTSYPYLSNVYTAIDYQVNYNTYDQGGDPVYTTIIMPTDAVMKAVISPALAAITTPVTDTIASLSPIYAETVLESYFLGNQTRTSSQLISSSTTYQAVNGATLPAMNSSEFLRTNVAASNGIIHTINTSFPASDRMKSALGQAMVDPDLATYLLALKLTGLLSTYGVSTRAGTYFAPTNAAFINAGIDLNAMTLNGTPLTIAQLTQIMQHHVIDNSNLTQTTLANTIVATDLGSTEQLTFNSTGLQVTSAGGIVGNVTYPAVGVGPSNVGYVYKVDALLLPL